MLKKLRKKLIKKLTTKPREYPIKYDESGRSARKRVFCLYNKGRMPKEVKQEMDDIHLPTAIRYYYQWKKLPKDLDASYRLLKSMLKSSPRAMQEMVEDFTQKTSMTEDEVLSELQKPWAFRRLVLGWWADKVRISQRDRIMRRLQAAAHMVYIFECAGIPPEKITEALMKLHK